MLSHYIQKNELTRSNHTQITQDKFFKMLKKKRKKLRNKKKPRVIIDRKSKNKNTRIRKFLIFDKTNPNIQDNKSENINNIEITASSGNDRVTVRNGKNIIVDLGNGNNNIELIDCENITVITGSGTDRFTVNNSSNITLKAGEGSDYFSVDAASLKTGTLKLDGGQFPFNSYHENWLTINGLAAGDHLVFNKDNFSNFSDLAFDHSARAKLVFESNTTIGKDYPPNSLYGSNSTDGYTLLEIHNINNADVDRLQSELWFMHGKKIFSSLPTDLGYITTGNWHVGTISKNQYLTFNDGSEKTISFENITNNISNPYVFNGDLMLSWII
jgi:hypothetical protein